MKCWQNCCIKRRKLSPKILLIGSAVGVVLCALLGIGLGAAPVGVSDWRQVLSGNFESPIARILLYVRLPRVAAGLFAGAGLAVAGVIIQTILGNPLAGPNIIGVNAGAGFFAVVCCALFPALPLLVPMGAFLGAMVSVLLVYGIAHKTDASRITIVLAGVAINSFLNACTDTVQTLIPDALPAGNAFRIGGLASVSTSILVPACVLIVIALAATFFLRNELELLGLGEETAASLGLPTKRIRFYLLLCAACLAGASVSFAGLIGFVGLIVPHAARFFVGSSARHLLPLSALWGAGLVVLCDTLSRILFAPYELPVGIVLSFLGAPFFVWLLIKKRGRCSHD